MSWDINQVVIVGRLTKDPELTYTQSGAAVCRFSIAVNRSSGSSRANQEDTTSFFNIVAWNKTAEICKEYLSKGRQVGIAGRIQQRRWSSEDGGRRNTVEIVANTVQFFGQGRPTQELQGAPSQEAYDSEPASDESPEIEKESEGDPFLSELDDDEIPF